MRAVVMQHEEHEGPGLLGPALEAAGFTLVKRFRTVKREDLNAELVVVLGGPMGVYEAERHPFLGEELGLVTERLALGLPVLGICLGAQLLAAAAGSEVFVGKNSLEVGVAPVRWTKEGLADPVIAGVRPRTTVAHWHQDTFKAVPGATLLASTDRYTQQAFRLGDSYGFQFHLELTADELDRWFTAGAEELVELYEKNLDELRSQLPKLHSAEAENRELLERLAHHFARVARAAR
ncbi:glutamine amidotransferase-related protein [Archangium lansingense]|uniref:Gamma-glutamyl-gamma-aminobutyrate hydrolase family protein n=1 Tax=Archangium lansingense TaxID=2995310 RepID=A0ABT4A923_9BACT|nr:gamma-glutamyl-gamma-aminobutyrate hydrolase family protein [Archangium lansinium]MCY1078115.1 gamma-glutamyl-gamma-aminobutyrate hydrolase family protein [Archangium lansinium]